MRFEIEFNRENNDKLLEAIGGVLTPTGATKYPPFEIYTIELDNFSDLDELLKKLNKEAGREIAAREYVAIVTFDPPCIFFDDNV